MFVAFFVHLQNQSQLIWGTKDKLKKFCSINDMKELLIANGQEVPSGESNVKEPHLVLILLYSELICILKNIDFIYVTYVYTN